MKVSGKGPRKAFVKIEAANLRQDGGDLVLDVTAMVTKEGRALTGVDLVVYTDRKAWPPQPSDGIGRVSWALGKLQSYGIATGSQLLLEVTHTDADNWVSKDTRVLTLKKGESTQVGKPGRTVKAEKPVPTTLTLCLAKAKEEPGKLIYPFTAIARDQKKHLIGAGDVMVECDGNLVATVDSGKGYATFPVEITEPGEHTLIARSESTGLVSEPVKVPGPPEQKQGKQPDSISILQGERVVGDTVSFLTQADSKPRKGSVRVMVSAGFERLVNTTTGQESAASPVMWDSDDQGVLNVRIVTKECYHKVGGVLANDSTKTATTEVYDT